MIWLVRAEEYDWDEYDAFVVRAETAQAAIEIAGKKFSSSQGTPTATLVTSEGDAKIILGSFRAG